MEFSLTEKEKQILLITARESISSKLEKRKGSYPAPTNRIITPLGSFVTLHIDGTLRGCIGHMLPVRALIEDIKILAKESAFRDPRFPSLSLKELELIDIEISVLSPLEVSSPKKIVVGKHGIIMKNGYNSGVLLPQVPVEQGWNREEFLSNTCRKAGMSTDCWKDPKTQIETFTAVIFGEKPT
ncbi:MAG: AmmeMemoRadiSam system protein A [Spirochaetia bacterium]|jgi:AmmeMemoRadiSam system protein A|nr:AmmeMemoRadiSam system protein A [Spirochaetia bacterium]